MSEKFVKYTTPIVALFFAAALGVTAATTIGTDITTEGALTVSGTTTISNSFTVDVAGGSDEFTVTDGAVETAGCNFYGTQSDINNAVGACGAGLTCDWYYDVASGPCYCNGTDWVDFSDDTTVCGAPDM